MVLQKKESQKKAESEEEEEEDNRKMTKTTEVASKENLSGHISEEGETSSDVSDDGLGESN